MAEKGLVVGTSGNISLRLPTGYGEELLAITPSSRYYDLLTPDDIPVINFEARLVEGELSPSSESFLHIGIYHSRKEVNAVMHTHSVYASAMAAAHLEIQAMLEEQTTLIGGTVNIARYAPSGSKELARNVVKALKNRSAALMMNHGVVGVGRDIREAFTVCETVEKAAQVFYLCATLGKVNYLPENMAAWGRSSQKNKAIK